MNALLILYNPYYQENVIESHLEILKERGRVAFGKVNIRQKAIEQPFMQELESIYNATNETNPLQLFLSDYASLFVAKVVCVSDVADEGIIPPYYTQKGFLVEKWFIISDMRELVRHNFEVIRDEFLSKITANNRTYSLYGNNYVYPLIIQQKIPLDYFEEGVYYKNIFKNDEYLRLKTQLMQFNFDTFIHAMTPDSLDNIISAELEYQQNKQDMLYDFSSVIVKYSKTMEKELYLLFYALFQALSVESPQILDVGYNVQGTDFILRDFFTQKPNLGTYPFLLKNPSIDKAQQSLSQSIQKAIRFEIVPFIHTLKALRNENVHGKSASLKEAAELRSQVIGVQKASILARTLEIKQKILNSK